MTLLLVSAVEAAVSLLSSTSMVESVSFVLFSYFVEFKIKVFYYENGLERMKTRGKRQRQKGSPLSLLVCVYSATLCWFSRYVF